MANHASAIKRDRQNRQRRGINQMNRSRLRTEIKKLKSVVEAGQQDEAQQLLPAVFSVIDRSVQKGVIKANAARRYKSRMNRRVNALGTV